MHVEPREIDKMSAGGKDSRRGGARDLPGGVKLHQDCVFALHEGLKVAISENHHTVLFFHLSVVVVVFVLLLVLVITFFSSLFPFFFTIW